ncbi:putative intracellular protease/amidase [Gillisia mitskevichiae]|uniref:Putative intracellular protease/amidase n=1 Tax=Gillisia mitskevichiae TaxID=270921 RepID=A0A495NWM2_9FLAO|nr:type 1 glutamine amidotransferase domain-containing protein [Gillisia mitskevichiae]RKS42814.1 putative intracellular protease/amidase [Gillisia mitskevichiae]
MKFKHIIVLALSLSTLTANSQNNKNNDQQNKDQKKVLFVLTSHDELGDTGEKTGFWVEEFAAPYYNLLDKGVKITIASPKGGKAPIDPRSKADASQTEATKRYNNDKAAQNLINTTVKLESIKAEDFDAVFYPGGHGPLWDLAESKTSIALIETFNEQKKPVAFVCHAPGVLKDVKNEKGEPFVKGKNVTGFTNTEEEAVQLTKVVPFLVEDILKENGGIYTKAANWNVHVVKDGNLITGQNPASSNKVAETLFESLK